MIKKKNCEGCKILEPESEPTGGVIKLGEHWLVNHYGGSEGYLGWLALQPQEHCMELEKLSEGAALNMGNAIKAIKSALKTYWVNNFKDDRFDRLYVTYFFDSVFDNNPTKYHLHIHLIPRTKKMRSLISPEGRINCWEIYKISKMAGFPEEYFRYEKRVEHLMDALRNSEGVKNFKSVKPA